MEPGALPAPVAVRVPDLAAEDVLEAARAVPGVAAGVGGEPGVAQRLGKLGGRRRREPLCREQRVSVAHRPRPHHFLQEGPFFGVLLLRATLGHGRVGRVIVEELVKELERPARPEGRGRRLEEPRGGSVDGSSSAAPVLTVASSSKGLHGALQVEGVVESGDGAVVVEREERRGGAGEVGEVGRGRGRDFGGHVFFFLGKAIGSFVGFFLVCS